MEHVFLTGVGGFIGAAVANRLLEQGISVIGIDNLNSYYEVSLKEARLQELKKHPQFQFFKIDLVDKTEMEKLFSEFQFKKVIHLAAQAGVRYSIQEPQIYAESNLTGFLNILELCRHQKIEHLVFASSSSVYGANQKMPFSPHDGCNHPVSFYAATKKANEMMAHSYSHLFGLPTSGLRFFTVYGPWGRPDMAIFSFTKAILEGKKIELFNHGKMQRDFTFIDDAVDGVLKILDHPPASSDNWDAESPDPATSSAPYRIYNVANGKSVDLLEMVEALENALDVKAQKEFLPMQAGEVLGTWADTAHLKKLGYAPQVPIQEGIKQFVQWYRNYYQGKLK
jgi:UDP-glucuronate 4-epimerase